MEEPKSSQTRPKKSSVESIMCSKTDNSVPTHQQCYNGGSFMV